MAERLSTQQRIALGAALGLLLLVATCGWGWQAFRLDVDTFVLPQAMHLEHRQLDRTAQQITYRYQGQRGDQRVWVSQQTRGRGWRRSTFLEDCEGRCSEESTRVYVRRLFFGVLRDVAMIDQNGDGPFTVRVTLRRCLRLPWAACWP